MTATDVPSQRQDVIDGLRGFALLGILWINISGHALPFLSMWDPTISGGTDAVNIGAWVFSEVFVEGAMRGLFSLLFGASTLLFLRAGVPAPGRGAMFFRRNLWLIAFGLVHGALLLMPGDILSTYGACGLVLYFFRNAPVRVLTFSSILCLAIICGLQIPAVNSAGDGGDVSEILQEIRIAAHVGYPALLPIYAMEYFYFIFSFDFLSYLLDALAMMFAGMALLKSGWLTEARFPSKGLLIGLALAIASIALRSYTTSVTIADNYADDVSLVAEMVSELARAGLSIAYAILFVGLWKAGALRLAQTPLGALGRMAFTHYIGGTIIATTLFYGHGFDLFERFDRIDVYSLAIAIWLCQAAFSVVWLRWFIYGPLEWAWRSLVRWSPQRIRR